MKDTVMHCQRVVPSREPRAIITLCDTPVQLPELRKCCSPHPHKEVLVQETIVALVCEVQLICWLGPVYGLHCTC